MIDLRFCVTVKSGSQIEVNFRGDRSVVGIHTNASIFFASTDLGDEKASVIWCWFPVELVSEGECLVDGHGPPVLGDSADDRHPLINRVDTELLAPKCRYRLIQLQTPPVYDESTSFAELTQLLSTAGMASSRYHIQKLRRASTSTSAAGLQFMPPATAHAHA